MLLGMLADSLRLFKSHYIGIAKIFLPIYIPIEIFDTFYSSYVLETTSGSFAPVLPGLIGLLAAPVYAAGVIFYIASVIADQPIDTKTAWSLGVKYWGRLLLLIIYVAIIVLAGVLALIIPGLIFVCLYSFSAFHLLLNNRSPVDAMRDSWHTTKIFFWTILGGYFVISVVLDIPYYGLLAVLEQRRLDQDLLLIVLNIMYAFLSFVYTIFAFRVYQYAKDQQNSRHPSTQ